MENEHTILHLQCSSCGADLRTSATGGKDAGPAIFARTCPFCESANVAPLPDAGPYAAPAVVIAFGLDNVQAKSQVQRYLKSRPLAPRREVLDAPLDRFRGVYVPAYLYSAIARCSYRTTIVESYVTTEKDPQTQEQKHVNHPYTVPFEGVFHTNVRDILVSASKTITPVTLETIKPFDLRLLRRYNSALLAGFWAEQHPVSSGQSAQDAQKLAIDHCRLQVQKLLPGDEHRDFVCEVTLENERLDPVFVPIWLFSITSKAAGSQKHNTVFVNGQTGVCTGEIPASPWAVFWGVVGFIAFILVIAILIYGVWSWL